MDFLLQAVSTIGFPIVCVGCSFWYINKTQNEYRQDYNRLHESHAKEVQALTTALTENTEVIRSLKFVLFDVLDGIEESDKNKNRGE